MARTKRRGKYCLPTRCVITRDGITTTIQPGVYPFDFWGAGPVTVDFGSHRVVYPYRVAVTSPSFLFPLKEEAYRPVRNEDD